MVHLQVCYCYIFEEAREGGGRWEKNTGGGERGGVKKKMRSKSGMRKEEKNRWYREEEENVRPREKEERARNSAGMYILETLSHQHIYVYKFVYVHTYVCTSCNPYTN